MFQEGFNSMCDVGMISHPCAKINLGLNIVAKRPDGYHDLETVFYPVDLSDTLEITARREADGGCYIEVTGHGLDSVGDDNLVAKAYRAVKRLYPCLPGVAVKLTKRIPMQAGMGGGSSDCAFTIMMLNKMFRLGMSVSEMRSVAASLGADCAFFINPVPSFATGIGDVLAPVDVDLHPYYIGIVKPKLKISTKEAFAHVSPKHPSVCCKDIMSRPVREWNNVLVNDFEQSIMPGHPEIGRIKQTLYDLGAVYAAMSGSGSALFGIFKCPPQDFDKVFRNCFTYIGKAKY